MIKIAAPARLRSGAIAGLAFALLAAAAVPAPAAPASPPKRMSSLTVYGNDPCPRSDDDEIVVCAREPESERYRIPRRLRKTAEEPDARSWTDRVAGVEEAGRPQRPNSCSTVGAAGQSGCTQAMLRQWAAERREGKAEASDVP